MKTIYLKKSVRYHTYEILITYNFKHDIIFLTTFTMFVVNIEILENH